MSIQHYELTFIVSGQIPENEQPAVIDKVKNLITSEDGKITNTSNLGRKKFAYPINHQKYGFYQIYEFDLANENLIKINQELKLNRREILRFLIIKKPVLTEAEPIPKVLAKPIQPTEKIKPIKKKISLEDLDKKLDEILDKEIIQ